MRTSPPRSAAPWGLLGFATGCALSLAVWAPTWVLPAALAGAVGARGRKGLTAVALLLAGLAAGNLRIPAWPSVSPPLPASGDPPAFLWVRGTVRSAEAWVDGCRAEVSLSSLFDGIAWRPSRARVQAYLPIPPPLEGSSLEASVRLVAPRSASNPGEFDRAGSLRRQGISLTASARSPELIRTGPPEGAAPLARYRRTLREALLRDGGAQGGMLLALLLGERGLVGPEGEEALSRSGLYHLMALSGFNVGLVLLAVFGVAHLLRVRPLRRDVAGLVVCLLYGLAVAERPSFTRALLMASAFLLARAAARPQPALRGWAFAAAALLAWNPSEILDAGFQLTFLATLGIVALHRAYPSFLPEEGWAGWVSRLFWVGFCAQLATLPILALQFHRISPLGWLATPVAALPLLAVQALGLLYMAGGFLVPGLGTVLGWGMEASSRIFSSLPEALASWPGGSLFVASPTVAWVGLYAVGLALVAASERRRGPGWTLAALACVGAWCAPRPFEAPPSPGVAVLSVGQASSQVIFGGELPLLVDAGNSAYRGPSTARQVMEPFLTSAGVRAVAGVLITHWDADHAGSLRDLLLDLPVGFVGSARTTPPPPEIARLCEERGVPVRLYEAGDRFRAGSAQVEALWPPRETACRKENDRCLVLRVAMGRHSALFPGDIEGCAEKELTRRGYASPAEVLLAPHHGGKHSCSAPFLGAVGPKWVLVSAGRHNRFGHPSPEALEKMGALGIRMARTDLDGGLWIDFGGKTPRIARWRDGDWSCEMRRKE